ncbi:hypothetical protein ACFOYW_04520 [Gryllotalpicola reticulitermitis]|uniref:Uncharacterized protein n=1 Tax=Gryllotalpicola reticulitermitis TaxID=1184153 RepID=A0ABV8Q4S4_9MICO
MTVDPAALSRTSRSLRGYAASGRPEEREDADARLSDLFVAAKRAEDVDAVELLTQARQLLALGPAGANEADNLLPRLQPRS